MSPFDRERFFSPLFPAIRFVLSDAYTSLSREDRQALLHDSSASTSTTSTAFVEIVFDNSDGRFPSSTSSSDLVLRRTIGAKRDDYSIDHKSATKTDVANLLEAAGFSRSNPYYIVPQGRITHLTNMKDQDRLNLLKDVAGTKVYESKRAESLRIIEETKEKKEKVRESLKYIQEQLDQLDEERQELREYYEKDKERKSLEYALLHQESQNILSKLDDLDQRRREEGSAADGNQNNFNDRETVLKGLEEELASLQHHNAIQSANREVLVQERRELSRTKAELEATIRDEEERAERVSGSQDELQARIKVLDQSISDAEAELMEVVPSWQDLTKQLEEKRADLLDSKARTDILYSKQGRSAQFRTQAERDSVLQAEIQSLDAMRKEQMERKSELQAEIDAVQKDKSVAEEDLKEKGNALEERQAFIQSAAIRWEDLRSKEDQLLDTKKDLWKEEHKLANSVNIAQERMTNAQRALASMMDRPTALGLANLDALVQRLGLQGVHGPLYKLFSVSDRYKTAVEVTAGQSLFHVVVDSDDIASQLIDVMNREKLGRVTFMPLNRLQPKAVDFEEKTDALIMFRRINFDEHYKKAMQQVFGRTIICPSLPVAASYVQTDSGINGITLDGDRVERKGALTGGYHDPKRSRLDAVRDLNRWQDAFTTDNTRLHEIRSQLGTLDQEITILASERSTLESRSKRAHKSREPILGEVQSLRETETSLSKRLEKLHALLAQMDRELHTTETKLGALTTELQSPLTTRLDETETQQLNSLNHQMGDIEREVTDLLTRVTELGNRKQMLEIEIKDNLQREREANISQIEALQSNGFASGTQPLGQQATDSNDRKQRLAHISAQSIDRQQQLEAVEREIEEAFRKTKETQDRLDETTAKQIEEARAISKHEKVLTKIVVKRRELEKRKDEVEQKVRELGVLSSDSLQKYVDEDPTRILKRLHKAQAHLKQFSSVNRRAIEQFDGFAKQKDQLLERQDELERSSESIQELIETLDLRKDDAIDRTFKQVSQNFAQVFEKLVPAGHGQLILETAPEIDVGSDIEMEDDSQERSRHGGNYIGVSIRVSFHSKQDEGMLIQQLSGGQKSLVALAIVFAIQKCDPAAFYLFDEIDANLDAQYRTAVAAMIHEQSNHAQFITTTFRPELIATADKCYGGKSIESVVKCLLTFPCSFLQQPESVFATLHHTGRCLSICGRGPASRIMTISYLSFGNQEVYV